MVALTRKDVRHDVADHGLAFHHENGLAVASALTRLGASIHRHRNAIFAQARQQSEPRARCESAPRG